MRRTQIDTEFSQFVVRERVGLVRTACLLTAGDVHTAEDIVQIVLARLYLVWPRMRDPSTVPAYARRCVVNAFLDNVRRQRRRREQTVAEVPDLAVRVPQPSWPGQQEEGTVGADGAQIRAALAQLPPRMRAVLVLRHWLDLSVSDTAALLGCSEGNVKSQNAKGTARLRELLSDGQDLAGQVEAVCEGTAS